MKNELFFRVSSGLKNLIGRELITDDFIAVFELVKNSFDARAKTVKVIFENIKDPQNAKIIIYDDGKGMDYDDIINKWLFVAYSAKRDRVEDQLEDEKKELPEDYRNRLRQKSSKFYAGAKGVGRFSCDRLGNRLSLTTLKNKPGATVENIEVDWTRFELNSKENFIDIPVKYDKIDKMPFQLANGTVLEISELNPESNWDRDTILALKDSLTKLITPTIEGQKLLQDDFQIIIECDDELHQDEEIIKVYEKTKEEELFRKVVNGPVNNFIFDLLTEKTAQLISRVSKDGKLIVTELIDRGTLIYETTEENPYSKLKDINYHLFYLTPAAKNNFTRRMGIEPVNYGNVFIYKNGFRINPYGEARSDLLGLDARKAQGHSRHLGTRDLIGKIEIRGTNAELKETTSRDGGLVKNQTYEEFLVCFKEKTLRRLEKYVVDVKKWGTELEEEDLNDLSDEDTQKALINLVASLTNSKELIDVKYNKNIVDILNSQAEKSVKKIIKNFKRIAEQDKNPELEKDIAILDRRVREIEQAKGEVDELENKLFIEKKKNLYLLSTSKDVSPEVLGLVHHIQLETSQIEAIIELLIYDLQQDQISKEELIRKLGKLKLHSDKTLKISKLITRSNFNAQVAVENADLAQFIFEYLSLYNELYEESLNFIIMGFDFPFYRRFSMIEFSIIIDNLISNAKKSGARTIKVEGKPLRAGKGLEVLFSDNGKGVNREIQEQMFGIGITTTTGSGIGLYTVRDLLNKLDGNIEFLGNNLVLSGATFGITL